MSEEACEHPFVLARREDGFWCRDCGAHIKEWSPRPLITSHMPYVEQVVEPDDLKSKGVRMPGFEAGTGKHDERLQEIKQTFALRRHDITFNDIGYLLERIGELQEALREANELVEVWRGMFE